MHTVCYSVAGEQDTHKPRASGRQTARQGTAAAERSARSAVGDCVDGCLAPHAPLRKHPRDIFFDMSRSDTAEGGQT